MVVSIKGFTNRALKHAKNGKDALARPAHFSRRKSLFVGVGLGFILVAVWTVGTISCLSYQIGRLQLRATASQGTEIKVLSQAAATYKLSLQYPSAKGEKTFPISDVGLSLNDQASLRALRGDVTAKHLLEWWRPIPAEVVWKMNQPKFSNFVAQNATVVIVQPTNANLAVSNGAVSIDRAKVGEEYGLASPSTTVLHQADSLSARPLILTAMPLDPSINSGQLAAVATKIQQILDEHLSVAIGGKTVTPTAADISSWLSLTPNMTGRTVDVTVNNATVNNYLANLANQDDQVEHDQIVVTLADGGSSVAVAGQNGVTITGQQTAANTINQNLLAGKNFSIALPATTEPYSTVTAGDWPKWIEVDLTTKRMYVYQDSNLVNTFLVTAGKPSTPTPTGTFYIWDKLTSQTMVGPGYVQPDVPWINYFDHSGDAIHGNYWRPSSVFGNVNTSHGCVGLQVGDAEWVYDWAPIGTPVVIHY